MAHDNAPAKSRNCLEWEGAGMLVQPPARRFGYSLEHSKPRWLGSLHHAWHRCWPRRSNNRHHARSGGGRHQAPCDRFSGAHRLFLLPCHGDQPSTARPSGTRTKLERRAQTKRAIADPSNQVAVIALGCCGDLSYPRLPPESSNRHADAFGKQRSSRAEPTQGPPVPN